MSFPLIPLSRSDLIIISCRFQFVKYFFEVLFRGFRSRDSLVKFPSHFLVFPALRDSFIIISHTQRFVNTFFQKNLIFL